MRKIFGGTAGKTSKPALIAVICIFALIIIFGAFTAYTYAHGDIFPRVSAGGIALGGMTRDEAIAAIDSECSTRYDGAKITIKLGDVFMRTVSAEELMVSLPSSEIADAALRIGHEGGLFDRLGDVLGAIFAGRELDVEVTVDEDRMSAVLAEFSAYDVPPVDARYEVVEDELVLYPRTDGKKVNTGYLSDALRHRFADEDFSQLDLEQETDVSAALDMDKVYSEVHKEAADARLEKKENDNIIVPHVVGLDFDLAAAKSKYDENPGEIIRIPLTVTQPEVFTKDLEATLFKATLSDVTTYFSPRKVARTSNVRLAAKLINGIILNPGEEFSYNEAVGPRTKERGFKEAAIFASGEVVDGIGGGICQVSSNVYMAAVKADMKITERKNHSFYVDYAPKGEDATVVYGSIDFRFVNTSPYPIKIVADSKNNYVRVRIMGTESEKFTVKLTKKTLSTRPFEERIKTVTSLGAGERRIEQKGQEGLVMEVYRNVYDANGKLIRSTFENKSTYKPMPQIVLVGAASGGSGASVPAVTDPPAETTDEPEATEDPEATENPEVTEDPEATEEPEDGSGESSAEEPENIPDTSETEATENEIAEGESIPDSGGSDGEIPDWLVP